MPRLDWQDEALRIFRGLNPYELTDQDLADVVGWVLVPEIIDASEPGDTDG